MRIRPFAQEPRPTGTFCGPAGSTSVPDSGNVNATAVGRRHFLAYYSGQAPNTSVCLLPVDAKIDKKGGR